MGIEQQNAGAILNGKQGLSRASGNALARHLGFRDVEHFLLENGVLAELRPKAGGPWGNRDTAVGMAPKLGYDVVAVEAVVSRFNDDSSRGKPMKWWFSKFFDEELERLADERSAPPASEVPVQEAKPAKRRARG